MSLNAGIVGLPNVGKSLLFNTLTNNNVPSENYPFCTIEPNVGTVEVKDVRLDRLASISNSKKKIYAVQDFTDIAGIVEGASTGAGLGNKFLSEILESDMIIQVVRLFEDSDVIHVKNRVDPLSDIGTINTELILKDIEILGKHIYNYGKVLRTDPDAVKILEYLKVLDSSLQNGVLAKTFVSANPPSDIVKKAFKTIHLLTLKPFLYVLNVSDTQLAISLPELLQKYQLPETESYIPLNIKLENEISKLSEAEKVDFMEMYGLKDILLNKLVGCVYQMLGNKTFFTTGEEETRAWTYRDGISAREAAGIIHTDFYDKFIAAEVVAYSDFDTYSGYKGVKDAGKFRLESRDYKLNDGDIIVFRHN